MQTSAKKACFQFAECSFLCKENANERKESLLSICLVQLFLCNDTTFPRNFQGFREKILEKDEEKNRVGGKRSSFFSYFRFPTSHTTVRAVPHTAVPILGTIRGMNPLM